MDRLGITLMGEVTNIFKVTKIIATNCAHRQERVTKQCLPDGQVYTFALCAEVCGIWKEDTWTQIILINCDILVIKPTRCTKFSNLFWNENLHVSDSSSVHHQEFFTVNTAMVYVIQVC